jgi:hypothetical protein
MIVRRIVSCGDRREAEGCEGLTIDVAFWPAKFVSKTLAVPLLRLRGIRFAAAPLSLAFAHMVFG